MVNSLTMHLFLFSLYYFPYRFISEGTAVDDPEVAAEAAPEGVFPVPPE